MGIAPIAVLRQQYWRALLEDVVPFWLRHSLDARCGGYLTCLDRDGSLYNDDKSVWFQGRQAWLFAKLYNEVEPRPEWLEAARSGIDFLRRYGYDSDGHMFFSVTRDGRPLRKRRYLFSETFAVIACAEYARATGDEATLDLARQTYRLALRLHRTPGALPPKVIPETRVAKALAMPMILLATTQELRLVDDDPLYAEVADDALQQITQQFWKADERVLHETVGPAGERLDSPAGRCLNPGHAIECAWFLLREAAERGDASLQGPALEILEASLQRGWDERYGGLFAFLDIEGRPAEQLEWDMKLWWPHTEALIATLMAYQLNGEQRWADWFERIHAWSWQHFPDPEYGEWFGYLHRDGSVANVLKGSLWKGGFHLPRALWLCGRILDALG